MANTLFIGGFVTLMIVTFVSLILAVSYEGRHSSSTQNNDDSDEVLSPWAKALDRRDHLCEINDLFEEGSWQDWDDIEKWLNDRNIKYIKTKIINLGYYNHYNRLNYKAPRPGMYNTAIFVAKGQGEICLKAREIERDERIKKEVALQAEHDRYVEEQAKKLVKL